MKADYFIEAGNRASLKLGRYNPAREVIIDPVLSFSTYLGGNQYDSALAVAFDSIGNMYITGFSSSLNFPTSIGSYQVAMGGYQDAFVTKLNPSGNGILYSTFIGGYNSDLARGIAVDASGNAYITGNTGSPNFPTTAGSFHPGNARDYTTGTFVSKLNAAGDGLVYSTFLSNSVDQAFAIAVDPIGSAYIAGASIGDFPVTNGAYSTAVNQGKSFGYTDVFVAKLSPTGDRLIYGTYLGGVYNDTASAIAVDAGGQAYVTGTAESPDFPTTSGAFQRNYGTAISSHSMAFLTCLDSTGTGLVYSTFLGGTYTTKAAAIALDSSKNVFLSGATSSFDFPVTAGAYSMMLPFDLFSTTHAFVSKINNSGSALLFSTMIGGSKSDLVSGMAVDSSGSAIIVGDTSSQDFPATSGSFPPLQVGTGTVPYLAKLNPAGSALVYSTMFGSSNVSHPYGIALDATGNPVVVGHTTPNFPTTIGSLEPANQNATNDPTAGPAFVAKFDLNSTVGCTLSLSTAAAGLSPGTSSGAVGVNVNSGCPWQATVTTDYLNTGFVTLTQPSGIGSGSISYSALANKTSASRTAMITVGSSTVTLTQGPCSYSVSPSSLQLPMSSGATSLTIATSGGCSWTGNSSASWLSITPSGTGLVATASYSTNLGPSRTASILLAGQTIPVTQSAYGTGTASGPAKVGVMQPSAMAWALDSNGNGSFDGGDRYFSFLAAPTDIAVVGDWTGDGKAKAGVYRNGFWVLDTNNNGVWEGPSVDRFFGFGGNPGDIPVVGDWNGDGRTKVGVYRHGFWILDTNGNGVFDAGDQFVGFGGNPGEQPVVGDWNGDGRTKIGFLYNGVWTLDYNGNGVFDAADKQYAFPYAPGDKAVVGDWNGSHTAKIGVYRSGFWLLDFNGNGVWDGPAGGDRLSSFGGNPGEVPVVGDWSGTGTAKIGFYYNGFWGLDYNGNGSFDGLAAGQDRFFALGGSPGDQPVVGAW